MGTEISNSICPLLRRMTLYERNIKLYIKIIQSYLQVANSEDEARAISKSNTNTVRINILNNNGTVFESFTLLEKLYRNRGNICTAYVVTSCLKFLRLYLVATCKVICPNSLIEINDRQCRTNIKFDVIYIKHHGFDVTMMMTHS